MGVLTDTARSGVPVTFGAEQVAGIIASGYEPPSDGGVPVSHWTPTEFEYRRHGTIKIVSPTIGPTRTEAGFAARIEATIDTDPSQRPGRYPQVETSAPALPPSRIAKLACSISFTTSTTSSVSLFAGPIPADLSKRDMRIDTSAADI